MIAGIGIDIVELARIEKAIARHPRFVSRILTEREQGKYYSLSQQRKVEFLAGRFAAKEAYAKAMGTGIGKSLSFLDIEVLPNENGKPIITSPSSYMIHVAISHSNTSAIAQVILES